MRRERYQLLNCYGVQLRHLTWEDADAMCRSDRARCMEALDEQGEPTGTYFFVENHSPRTGRPTACTITRSDMCANVGIAESPIAVMISRSKIVNWGVVSSNNRAVTIAAGTIIRATRVKEIPPTGWQS